MKIIYGFALLNTCVLLVYFIAKVKRMPAAPKWMDSNLFVHPFIFFMIAGIAFGTAFAIEGLAGVGSLGFGAPEAILLALVAGATVLSVVRIRAIGRTAPRREKWQTAAPVQPKPAVGSN